MNQDELNKVWNKAKELWKNSNENIPFNEGNWVELSGDKSSEPDTPKHRVKSFKDGTDYVFDISNDVWWERNTANSKTWKEVPLTKGQRPELV